MRGLARRLYFWVLVGIVTGCVLGIAAPATAVTLKPLSDGFINLVKMLIGPIVFLTVVLGFAGAGDIRKVGRVGVKALVYFEVVSTLALIIGLIVVNTMKPGAGFNVDPATLDTSAVATYTNAAATQTATQFILHIIPRTFADAFSGSGDMLQVLLIAILFGYALSRIGARGDAVHRFLEQASHIFFGMMNVVMKLAPIGAGAAMAFTLGAYGLAALMPLARLMVSYYVTCLLFIGGVLGLIAAWTGFSIVRFILYIKDEVLTVLGTSSSESALVPLMQKLEKLGCSKSVVGLVIPTGMSFNMDGTNIYLTMAALVPGAGDEHRSVLAPAVVAARRGDAHVERHGGRLRRQLHHPCGHVGGGPGDSRGGTGADSWRGSIPGGNPHGHKLHRQRSRRRGDFALGGGAGRRQAGPGAEWRRGLDAAPLDAPRRRCRLRSP